MNNIFYSCRDVTEKVEKKKVIGLSFFEAIRYNGHLQMCRACRAYERQSALLERAINGVIQRSLYKNESSEMDEATKAKIIEELKKVR